MTSTSGVQLEQRAAGEGDASRIYGAYLALVYAAAIFGGYVADRVLGYQRSILTGAIIMAAGLFMISLPQEHIFKLGLATIIVGNGLFKPNISTMVGKLYGLKDERRDSGFTIFYMGINIGAMIAPVLTEYLARKVFGTDAMPSYKVVFIASGVGMLISLVWFYIGRAGLKGIGAPPAGAEGFGRIIMVLVGAVVAIPVAYFLLATGATALAWILGAMFTALAILLLVEGIREGKVQRDRVIAMLIIFAFNVMFWMFFEQAGSSFTFLAKAVAKIAEEAVARRRQFNTVLAGTGVIQQGLLRWQGHALACPSLGQVAGRIGQSFGVVAVHGRSGRLRRRGVD